MSRVQRQSKAELDTAIVDQAAALFAKHGFKKTSVQMVADAVGFSKAGLLHRFPSKEAIEQAVVEACQTKVQELSASLSHIPLGYERDHAAIERIVDAAQEVPGLARLLLSTIDYEDDHEIAIGLTGVGIAVFEIFGADLVNGDPLRNIRIAIACGGLALICVGIIEQGNMQDTRPLIIQTCLNTLGHFDAPATKEK